MTLAQLKQALAEVPVTDNAEVMDRHGRKVESVSFEYPDKTGTEYRVVLILEGGH